MAALLSVTAFQGLASPAKLGGLDQYIAFALHIEDRRYSYSGPASLLVSGRGKEPVSARAFNIVLSPRADRRVSHEAAAYCHGRVDTGH
jgi:hypothetical protein